MRAGWPPSGPAPWSFSHPTSHRPNGLCVVRLSQVKAIGLVAVFDCGVDITDGTVGMAVDYLVWDICVFERKSVILQVESIVIWPVEAVLNHARFKTYNR